MKKKLLSDLNMTTPLRRKKLVTKKESDRRYKERRPQLLDVLKGEIVLAHPEAINAAVKTLLPRVKKLIEEKRTPTFIKRFIKREAIIIGGFHGIPPLAERTFEVFVKIVESKIEKEIKPVKTEKKKTEKKPANKPKTNVFGIIKKMSKPFEKKRYITLLTLTHILKINNNKTLAQKLRDAGLTMTISTRTNDPKIAKLVQELQINREASRIIIVEVNPKLQKILRGD
ncbi:MAG: hypothetical protein Q7S21_06855 [archaeon]|nr:hypothetical protein [archaeon]